MGGAARLACARDAVPLPAEFQPTDKTESAQGSRNRVAPAWAVFLGAPCSCITQRAAATQYAPRNAGASPNDVLRGKTSKDPSSFDNSTPSRTRTCNLVLSLPHQVSLTVHSSALWSGLYLGHLSPGVIVSTVSGGIPQPFGHSWPDCSSGPRCVKRFHGDILAD